MDPRINTLAQNLVRNSCTVKPGENVLIDAIDVPDDIVVALVRAIRAVGGTPFVNIQHTRVNRELLAGATEAQYLVRQEVELRQMEHMQAYIALRGASNIFETSDVPAERMKLANGIMRAVINHRVNKTKWCVLRWPTSGMAQLAQTSTEAFEDFYFRVCCFDHSRMEKGMNILAERMRRADKVRIKGPGTDLGFSIKGIGAVACGGAFNIPDGEVFSAPVKDSIEGVISYNAPSLYQGVSFDKVCLRFSKGKIVEATCAGDSKRLNEILDSDEGARYVGEFAIGFNPFVLEPMRDILFDEKIAGSFHFTPGQAYETADNGNRSQVHWDLVCIQRPEHGGGEIWFDDELIRKDGIFVTEDLKCLNPEALIHGA